MPGSQIAEALEINPSLLAFKPRQVALLSNPPIMKLDNVNDVKKPLVLKPEQKTLLFQSIAQYLQRSGFSKTVKKFISEAKIQRDDLGDSSYDLEDVFCKFLDMCNDVSKNFKSHKVKDGEDDATSAIELLGDGKKKKGAKTSKSKDAAKVTDAAVPVDLKSEGKKRTKKDTSTLEQEQVSLKVLEVTEEGTNVKSSEEKETKNKKSFNPIMDEEKPNKSDSTKDELQSAKEAEIEKENKNSKKRKRLASEENAVHPASEKVVEESKPRKKDKSKRRKTEGSEEPNVEGELVELNSTSRSEGKAQKEENSQVCPGGSQKTFAEQVNGLSNGCFEKEGEKSAKKTTKKEQNGSAEERGKKIMSDSGARHTFTRGIDASIRRKRAALRLREPEDEPVCHPFDDEGDDADFLLDVDDIVGHEEEQEVDPDFVAPGYEEQEVDPDFVAPSDSSSAQNVRRDSDGRFTRIAASTRPPTKRQRQANDTSWILDRPMPGGPIDISIIPSYGGHVARRIWEGGERHFLKCHVRSSACTDLIRWWSDLSEASRTRLSSTGLSHLPHCMFSNLDMPLISAFVERWQPDTNSFHLPFGEMTIMLHDVWFILRVPVDGAMICTDGSASDLRYSVRELLRLDALSSEFWDRGGATIDGIFRRCRDMQRPIDTVEIAWMLICLGSSLFVDKSGTRVRPHPILELQHRGVDTVSRYSWGSAVLAVLYRQLGIASREICAGISGCLTLLQAWIYEYFPCFRPHSPRLTIPDDAARVLSWSVRAERKDDLRLQSIRLRLDQMTSDEVTWLPYSLDPSAVVRRTLFTGWIRYRDIIEPYQPERVVRQLGFIQRIPSPPFVPDRAYRPADSKKYEVVFSAVSAETAWRCFPASFFLGLHDYVRDVGFSTDDYLPWFMRISHSQISPGPVQAHMPDRTNTSYWVDRWIRATQPFLQGRNELPNADMKTAADELENIIRDWMLFSK